MFKSFFKWIAEWFSSEFPPIQDPPPRESTEIAVVEIPKKPQSIEEFEKELGMSKYRMKELRELRKFISLLGTKELIGYKNNLARSDDEDGYRSFTFKYLSDVTIFTKDGFEFKFKTWEMRTLGVSRYMQYSAYEVITAAAQGHLFDGPTILRKPEHKRVCDETQSYEKSGYLARHEDQEQLKYLKQVAERTLAHIEKLTADLPIMDKQTNRIPVFHKLWEQMDLPLDTGTELVKL